MTGNNDSLKNAFDTLNEIEQPTERQKDNMLNYILSEGGKKLLFVISSAALLLSIHGGSLSVFPLYKR